MSVVSNPLLFHYSVNKDPFLFMVCFNKELFKVYCSRNCKAVTPVCIWELVLDLVDSILAYFNALGTATIQKRVCLNCMRMFQGSKRKNVFKKAL